MPDELTSKEQLDFLKSLLDRYETKKANVANRVATILSAHALLIVAIVYFIDKAQLELMSYTLAR